MARRGVWVGPVALAALACGSRTGVLLVGPDGGFFSPERPISTSAFCSSTLGPVDSCDAGPNAGEVDFCVAQHGCNDWPDGSWHCFAPPPPGVDIGVTGNSCPPDGPYAMPCTCPCRVCNGKP